jgi:hypothetical protein
VPGLAFPKNFPSSFIKRSGFFPGNRGEHKAGGAFNQWILDGKTASAAAAPAALDKKTCDGEQFKPSERLAARKAARPAAEGTRSIAKRYDIKKTPDDRAERKEEHNQHERHKD